MRIIICALFALALAACAGGVVLDPTRSYQMEADVACRSIGASLAALAPYRQSLSDTVEATVERVRRDAEPICNHPNPPTGADVASQLTRVAFDLLTAEKGVAR